MTVYIYIHREKLIDDGIIMPPFFEEGGAYCVAHVGRLVGMSVGRYVGIP